MYGEVPIMGYEQTIMTGCETFSGVGDAIHGELIWQYSAIVSVGEALQLPTSARLSYRNDPMGNGVTNWISESHG
jgi:hypothetical protein